MVGMDPGLARDQIARELVDKAAELWGRDRAEAVRPFLEGVADNLWIVRQNPPDPEQEPAFFLL